MDRFTFTAGRRGPRADQRTAYLVSTGCTPAEAWGKSSRSGRSIRPTVARLELIDLYAAKLRGVDAAPPLSKNASVPEGSIQQAAQEQTTAT